MKTAETLTHAIGMTGNTAMTARVPLNMTKNQTLLGQTWLGQNKWVIEQDLLRLNYATTAFAHWLYVPALGILLHFEHQICVAIAAVNPTIWAVESNP